MELADHRRMVANSIAITALASTLRVRVQAWEVRAETFLDP